MRSLSLGCDSPIKIKKIILIAVLGHPLVNKFKELSKLTETFLKSCTLRI